MFAVVPLWKKVGHVVIVSCVFATDEASRVIAASLVVIDFHPIEIFCSEQPVLDGSFGSKWPCSIKHRTRSGIFTCPFSVLLHKIAIWPRRTGRDDTSDHRLRNSSANVGRIGKIPRIYAITTSALFSKFT